MIDWQRISELRDEIGADDFDEVVDLFLAEVEETLEALPNAENSQLEPMLHLLKGSALNLGFQAFANRCLEGEAAARADRPEEIDRDAIRQLYDASRSAFLQQITA
ncbi:Hpt domain-containing protein [Primorskyibacter flagellatus]|uniref:Hpt domain-containing protein n=1 Tax=Primorskyibacter flagellatus TaxID=1387277 RepID=A0A1W2A703_9RHOB|nr:Hpt domain-containing protein [Primorskyibacter flagellatus]SMC56242.1 Hpt domain-containing protein [Primorskyibacter flagellatus]